MEEFFRYYNLEPDTKRADWVVERRVGPRNTLHSVVPTGFASYARILHPAWSAESLDRGDEKAWNELRAGWREAEDLAPVRWDDTAAENSRHAHRLMQWSDICSPGVRKPGMAGTDPPLEGELTPEIVEKLFDVLATYSDEYQEVLCGFWEGYGRFYTSRAKARFKNYAGDQSYIIFNSTLAGVRDGWLAALEYSYRNHGIGTNGLAPNAVWPTTREWYLAVDYNLRSTYLGGPASLIDSVCAAANLEAYVALPGDKIS